jgi:hypothetical protein
MGGWWLAMHVEYARRAAALGGVLLAVAAYCVWAVAFPPHVSVRSLAPGAMVRLAGVHAEETQHGVPFRWSGPRPRLDIRCLPLARPTALRLVVQPEPGGREFSATVLVRGVAVTSVRTTEPDVTIPIAAGACARGTAVVEIRPRTVVPPGDPRVIGMKLLGGQVDYAFGLAAGAVWVRQIGPLLIVVALLVGSGLLPVRGKHDWRVEFAGAGAAALVGVAMWPLAAPVSIPLVILLVVAPTLMALLPPRSNPARLARLTVLVIVAAFATLMVVHAVDLPRQDEWPEIVHRLRLAKHGQWDGMDWFAQSSQHRHAVPRLVLVAVALATSWSASAVAWVAVVVHIASWLAVVWLMRADLDDWSLLALSLVWFSPAQYESFIWGWALHGGLTLLFSVIALVAIEARRGRAGVLVAVACCTLASYCTAPGLVSWIVCAGVLVAHQRWQAASCLALSGVTCLLTYFVGYVRPGEYAALQFRIADHTLGVGSAIGVALGVLAQPFGLAPGAAAIVGASWLSLVLAAAGRAVAPHRLGLALLGVAWWLATILGRYDGTTSMLAISRYGWTVLPLWTLLAATPRPPALRLAALALCAVAGTLGWTNGAVAIDRWHGAMDTARDALLSGYTPEGTALYWAPEAIPDMLTDLRRWRYSLYRDQP